MSISEEYGDLFEMGNEWCLAHCVGNDFRMGKGIATIFKKKYGNEKWLIENSRGIGTALLLSTENNIDRNIFYLITKKWSKDFKPPYENIEKSIKDMFDQAELNGIKKIAMPKIGCGLDGLDWNIVKGILESHKPHDIQICVKYIN